MKQTIVGLLVAIVFTPLTVFAAGSATLTLNQESIAPTKGELFDIQIFGNANSQQLDTVRAVLAFDPTVVRVQSVRLNGLFDRSAPGNYLDNQNGKVSWGAFTLNGPINGEFTFAVVTFMALSEGNALISISPDSRMISDGNEKIDSGALGSLQMQIAPSVSAPEGSPLLVVNSDTHLNDTDWYASNTVSFNWVELPAEKKITKYLTAFDQSSSTDPSETVAVSESTKTYNDASDGIHYFHIKGQLEDGGFTPTIHRAVKVDVTAPNEFTITPSDIQILESESLWLTFATTDETSGVFQYQMAMNDSAFQVQESPLEVTDLKAGTYFFRVAALDRAGNPKYSGVSVRVYPEGTEIERPQGYEQAQEIGQVKPAGEALSIAPKKNNRTMILLITFVLVALGAFGIIYGKKFLKR